MACAFGAKFFLRKEKLVWIVVKRDLWEALDCALKDEIRFSTKAKRNEGRNLRVEVGGGQGLP